MALGIIVRDSEGFASAVSTPDVARPYRCFIPNQLELVSAGLFSLPVRVGGALLVLIAIATLAYTRRESPLG